MSPVSLLSRRFGFTWLWVLVPLLGTLWLSWTWTPNYPHADHWSLEGDLILAEAEGKVTWEVLAQQKNDSRYVVSRVCYLALAKATQWNVRIEAAVCVLMAGGIAVVGWWMARRTIAGRAADGAGAMMALLILTPHQVMNWNFGVQICYFLPVGAAVGIAAVFMTRWSLGLQVVSGILLAMLGTWSFAPGWLGWGLVVWGVLGWSRRIRVGMVVLALTAVFLALVANLWFYFKDYQFAPQLLLAKQEVVTAGAVLHYFLDLLGAGFAEGWPQANQAGRGRLLDFLGPVLGVIILLWVSVLAVLHWRDLLRRTGAAPSWMWMGLTGWAFLAVAMVAVARTGNELSNSFASRYLAFSLWAWAGAVVLTSLLPSGRRHRFFIGVAVLVMGWGWVMGALTGIKYLQRNGYSMRLLQGALTMAKVAPEPMGLRGNDPRMHTLLPMLDHINALGYLHPPLVSSPLVSDAVVVDQDPVIEGQLGEIELGPPLRVSGYAIDHRRQGPADSIVLSYQPEGGEEIWWTPVTSRTLDQPWKRLAKERGFLGEHARIGWEWVGGQEASEYQIVTLPARACLIRAYVMDGTTGTFYRLAGEKQIVP